MVLDRGRPRPGLDDPWIRATRWRSWPRTSSAHVLGLRHAKNTCAAMSYQRREGCPKSAGPWQMRCRLLERTTWRARSAATAAARSRSRRSFCDAGPARARSRLSRPRPSTRTARVDRRWTPAPAVMATVVAVGRDECSDGRPSTSCRRHVHHARAALAGGYCVSATRSTPQGRPGPATLALRRRSRHRRRAPRGRGAGRLSRSRLTFSAWILLLRAGPARERQRRVGAPLQQRLQVGAVLAQDRQRALAVERRAVPGHDVRRRASTSGSSRSSVAR